MPLKPSTKLRIGAPLVGVGFAVLAWGWSLYERVDVDVGGTIALFGAAFMLVGFGIATYNYKQGETPLPSRSSSAGTLATPTKPKPVAPTKPATARTPASPEPDESKLPS